MVYSEQMEHGSVKVADIDGVFDDIVAEVVGLAVLHAAFDPAAGEPTGEAAWMMVAAIDVGCNLALAVDCAAEFTGEDAASGAHFRDEDR